MSKNRNNQFPFLKKKQKKNIYHSHKRVKKHRSYIYVHVNSKMWCFFFLCSSVLRRCRHQTPNFSFAEPRTMSGIEQGHVGTGEYIFLHKTHIQSLLSIMTGRWKVEGSERSDAPPSISVKETSLLTEWEKCSQVAKARWRLWEKQSFAFIFEASTSLWLSERLQNRGDSDKASTKANYPSSRLRKRKE